MCNKTTYEVIVFEKYRLLIDVPNGVDVQEYVAEKYYGDSVPSTFLEGTIVKIEKHGTEE